MHKDSQLNITETINKSKNKQTIIRTTEGYKEKREQNHQSSLHEKREFPPGKHYNALQPNVR